MPLAYDRSKYDRPKNDPSNRVVVLSVGQRSDRVWHFWSASPRAALPPGELEGCTVKARVKISSGALLQMGMDCWRSPIVLYGPGGNNHEAGTSNWYFPSAEWQEALHRYRWAAALTLLTWGQPPSAVRSPEGR